MAINHKAVFIFLSVCSILWGCNSIEGNITSESISKNGIEGVTLVIAKKGKMVSTVVTNKYGRFSMPNLADGKYTVTPRYQDGTTFTPSTQLVKINGRDVTNIDFIASIKTKYFIITIDSIVNGSANLAAFADNKIEKGYEVILKTVEEIDEQQSGTDTAQKIRNYLKSAFSQTPVGYLLLLGDQTVIPLPGLSLKSEKPSRSVQSDFYYEYLSGDIDKDADGYAGEYGDDVTIDDLEQNLIAGRIPYNTIDLVDPVLENIMIYENSGDSFKQDVLIAAAYIGVGTPGDIMPYIENVLENYIIPAGFNDTTLCQDMSSDYADGQLTADVDWFNTGEIIESSFIDTWSAKDFGSVLIFADGGYSWASVDYTNEGGLISPFFSTSIEGTALDFKPMEPAIVAGLGNTFNQPQSFDSLGNFMLRKGFAVSVLGTSVRTIGSNEAAQDFSTANAQFEFFNCFYVQGNSIGYSEMRALDYLNENAHIDETYSGPDHLVNVYGLNIIGDPSLKTGL